VVRVGHDAVVSFAIDAPVLVPTARYTSVDWAALETERLWPTVWQLACSLDHVASPGDFYEHRVGLLSVLVVRGDDGELRAFQNVCRHRGNPLCEGAGTGLTELRCGFHRWCWDLRGDLHEVPSRKGFGALRNEDVPLLPVAVDSWGPLVFVNLDPDAMPLAEWLEGVPDDIAWARLEDFRCTASVAVPVVANWKTASDGFSETYHLQGLHREMLPVVDDVDAPQRFWDRHGKSTQRYGVPSPRLGGGVTDQQVWDAFILVMGTRVGIPTDADPGPAPEVPDGSTLSAVIAARVRKFQAEQGVDLGGFAEDEIMCLQQYNLFPNITVLVYADLLQVLRARPGATPDDAFLDGFFFERHAAGDPSPRTQPMDVSIAADEADFGMVLNQDFAILQRAQRGLHQPGMTHLRLSAEEARIVNFHRQLERTLGVESR
jgi:phenylpropionate dioxygenase-like ring-hydroxylating dioxygenase large terminal subunit